MKNIGIALLVLAVLGGGYMVMTKGMTPKENMVSPTIAPTAGESMMPIEQVQELIVDSFEFGYDQKELTVKKGQTVQITLTNSGKMPHDWVVDEIAGAKTQMIKNGETTTIAFVADTAGEFEYYCSVGQHRQQGMVGKLIVEE
jgi:plastocyanin